MSTDWLGLGLPSLSNVPERLCGIEPFFSSSKQAYMWRSFLKSLKKLLPYWEAISARTPLLLLSSSFNPPASRASSLCVCSPMGVWQSEAGSVWGEGGGSRGGLFSLGQCLAVDWRRPLRSPHPHEGVIHPTMVRGLTLQPSQEAHRTYLQVVMWAGSGVREVVDIDHREQGGVQGVEHKMGLVPAAIFYLKPTNVTVEAKKSESQ